MALFISEDEISPHDLSVIVDGAYSNFDVDEVLKVTKLEGDLNIAELFHGPTMTFKDLGLSIVGRLYDYFLEKRRKNMIVLVGTSGDTGSAAIHAVKDLKWVDIIVLLPKGRCTEIQERQMTTVITDNVHNFAGSFNSEIVKLSLSSSFSVEGNSDELDAPIKALFTDWAFVKENNICNINSLNWARVLIQMAHFIYCYFQACNEVGGEVEFVVPTGACGNIAACVLAKKIGFLLRAVAVVGVNDIVHRTVSRGDFSASGNVAETWSSAMDIEFAYNLERIFWLANGFDSQEVEKLMKEFEETMKVQLKEDVVEQLKNAISGIQVLFKVLF